MSDEFKALIDSVGNMTLDMTKGMRVRAVRIVADEDLYTAELAACVDGELSDSERESLMQRLLDARSYYLDELSITLLIEECAAQPTEDHATAGTREFEYV